MITSIFLFFFHEIMENSSEASELEWFQPSSIICLQCPTFSFMKHNWKTKQKADWSIVKTKSRRNRSRWRYCDEFRDPDIQCFAGRMDAINMELRSIQNVSNVQKEIGIDSVQIWIDPAQIWIDPAQIWIVPAQIWIAPAQIWIVPAQIWIDPTQICQYDKSHKVHIISR